MTDKQIEWQNDHGDHITITAEAGALFVSIDGDDIQFEHKSASRQRVQGKEVLYAGIQHDTSGERFKSYLVIDGRVDEIEQLREDSKNTDPLAYGVEEYTKTIRSDWGHSEVTKVRLSANKGYAEMTDREQELDIKIDNERDVPEDAEAGDVLAPGDLLGDTRTAEERDQDALDEAAETGEEVVVKSWTEGCDGSAVECSTDRVSRVAMPDGAIDVRRVHTH